MRALIPYLAVCLVGCNCCPPSDPKPPDYGDLPRMPIDMFQVVPDDYPIPLMSRSRGIVDIRLSKQDPSMTIWNDPETERDPLDTISLIRVMNDCTAVVEFGGSEMAAKPGQTFPMTGLVLVDARPDEQSVWIRSRWTRTVMHVDYERFRRMKRR